MEIKKVIPAIIFVIVLAALVVGYLYFVKPKPKKQETKGTVGTAEQVSESVPKIVTNPAETVTEVNPLDRANPFKYVNPLR